MVRPAREGGVDLEGLVARLDPLSDVEVHAGKFAVQINASGLVATVFADGRAIVRGTAQAGRARSFYSRYVG
jgi:adenylyltransferase/sulfurtransferase